MATLIQPVVLAGGAGTRLWPISTEKRPKHLLEIIGTGTMLEQTLERVRNADLFLPPIIVGAAAEGEKLARLAPSARLILEPCPRGSAAAIAFAAFATDPDSVLLVLPSDHHIADPAPLFDAIRRAIPAVQSGRLITFGIQPDRAETGYGYITAGGSMDDGVFEARSFIEKPTKDVAARLVESGSAFWNSGMFLFSAGVFLEELERHAPAIYDATRAAMANFESEGDRACPDESALASCPSTSIDYAVMEHSDRIAVVPVQLDWSDVGSWSAVYDLAPKDVEGNVRDERSHALGSRGCLMKSTGPRIVAIGVEDLVIIASGDHVLVVPRSEAQRVREAAELLKRR
jgi:mannose-1-phosphate guanylyltransferase